MTNLTISNYNFDIPDSVKIGIRPFIYTPMLKFLKTKSLRCYCTLKTHYTIPEKYRNAFYAANAPLLDYTNWFVHRAYEACFPSLVQLLQKKDESLDDKQAVEKVTEIINLLEPCSSLIDLNFPIKRADGHNEVIRGFRAMHCLNLYDAPCLGGMRICSDLNKDHVKAFSVLSTYKHACLGIEMSGAHGGLKISGYDYEPNELKDIVVSYSKELARRGFLGSYIDVLEPDLYCSSQEMGWIAKEFEGRNDFEDDVGIACAVGKPRAVGGLEIYDKSLAHGVLYALQLFLNEKTIMDEIEMTGDLTDKKFIIQGLGKVGTQIVLALTKAGATCVGIKEHDAFIYMEDGVPVEEILDYKDKNDSIQEFNKHTKPTSVDEIYMEPCDILIFAATHRSLQSYVAEKVQAKVLVEAAHAPITPTAQKVLLARKRLILPDIFAGCGASVTSYLEYVNNLQYTPHYALISRLTNLALTTAQNVQINIRDEDKINDILERMMQKSYEEILSANEEYKLDLDMRCAAYINAIMKIFKRIIENKKY